jgi:hypothetical protein
MKDMKPNENITQADIAFGPKNLADFLPPMSSIPKEFFGSGNPWNKWVSKWFFGGLKEYAVAVEGINFKQAHAHLKVILGSFEPKHEHKIAGCAYLASKWFDESTVAISKALGEE